MATKRSVHFKATALVLCGALGGCAGWSTETKIEEGAYQALSAADTVQSLSIAREPDRYVESSYPTAAVIGHHPSVAGEMAWGIGRGAFHYVITDALETHDAPRWVRRAWQVVNIGIEGNAVHRNWQLGLHFGHTVSTQPVSCEPTTTRSCL